MIAIARHARPFYAGLAVQDRYKALSNSYATVGIEIVLSVALGFFGGRWLDDKLHTAPALMVLGFFFGVGAAIKAVLRASKEMRVITEREEREQGNPAPLFNDKKHDKKRDEDRDDGAVDHQDDGDQRDGDQEDPARSGSSSDRESPTKSPEDRA